MSDLRLKRVKFMYDGGESTGTIMSGVHGAKTYKVMTDASLTASSRSIVPVPALDVIALGGHDYAYGGGERAPDEWTQFVQAV